MKTAHNTDSSPEDICQQAAKLLAGVYWFPLCANAKTLVRLLEEQKYLEPRGDSAYVGHVFGPTPDASTQMDLLLDQKTDVQS